jgi:hypothetical protein
MQIAVAAKAVTTILHTVVKVALDIGVRMTAIAVRQTNVVLRTGAIGVECLVLQVWIASKERFVAKGRCLERTSVL